MFFLDPALVSSEKYSEDFFQRQKKAKMSQHFFFFFGYEDVCTHVLVCIYLRWQIFFYI